MALRGSVTWDTRPGQANLRRRVWKWCYAAGQAQILFGATSEGCMALQSSCDSLQQDVFTFRGLWTTFQAKQARLRRPKDISIEHPNPQLGVSRQGNSNICCTREEGAISRETLGSNSVVLKCVFLPVVVLFPTPPLPDAIAMAAFTPGRSTFSGSLPSFPIRVARPRQD